MIVPPAELTWPPVQRVLGISPHGIGSAAGFMLGAMLLLREVRRRGDLDEEVVTRALTWALFGAIVGARLDYVVSHPGSFDSLWEALKVWEGGVAMFGGFIGGVAAALPVLLRHRVHLPRFLDAAAPGFAVGIVVGRLGDLVIWDHLGDPSNNPVALTIERGYELAPGFEPSPAVALPDALTCEAAARTQQFFAGCSYHQPALYDLVGALALLGVLLWVRRRARARAGVAILLWGAWYGTQRVVVDVTRSIDEKWAGLSGTQWLAIVLATSSVVALVVVKARGRGLGEEPGDPPSRAGALVRQSSSAEDSAASSAPSA